MTKTLLISAMGLSIIPTSTSLQTISSVKTEQKEIIEDQPEEEYEGCTVMYVGKDVSADGRSIIARSSDSSPHSMLLNAQVFKHNELANTTVYSNKGFSWQMPSTTYRYISTPRNPIMGKGFHWEASGINEKGFGVSATLSCATNGAARTADPLIKEGISEDNITQIICATSTTAREGMKYLAHIIDEKGNADANAILMVDQHEAWYMEMYTGHEYVAVKLPDNKACTIGNEFNLDSLADFADEDIIASPRLFTLPVNPGEGKTPFAVYDEGHEGENKHLDLFHTYAEPLKATSSSDHCHTRTWRGHNMFCHKDPNHKSYSSTKKYPAFFTPDNKLSVNDVKLFMRDRYEDISDPNSSEYIPWFGQQAQKHNLYYVANEGAYQVHIIKTDPNVSPELGCQEWLCLSCSNCAPFIPLSSACTNISQYYSHKSTEYAFDEEAACCIYRALNRLADTNRDKYDLPTQHVFEHYEDIWQQQFNQVLDEVKDMPLARAQDIITNFTIHLQDQAIALSQQLYEFLLLHAIDDYSATLIEPWTLFHPYVDLKEYSGFFGWSYEEKDKVITLKNKDQKVVVDANYNYFKKGTITNGKMTEDVKLAISHDKVYLDFDKTLQYLADGFQVAKVDISEYESKLDPLVWIIPVSIVVPVAAVGGGIACTKYVFKVKGKKGK